MRAAIAKYGMKLATRDGKEGILASKATTAKQIETVKEVVSKLGRDNLIAELKVIAAEQAAANEVRQQELKAREAERQRIDQKYIDVMNLEAEKLRKEIPHEHVEVTAKQIGDSDGHPLMKYFVGDLEVNWRDINVIGWAHAIRDGAMGAFAQVCIASLPQTRLQELIVESEAREKEAAERKLAAEKAKEEREAFRKTMTVTIIKSGSHRGEDGNDPYAVVSITDGSETLRFSCRNIFDFGYVVNPEYAVAPGLEKGGLRNKDAWKTFEDGKGWYDVRPLTEFEKKALDYLYEFSPIATSIRM